jgi:hypothetical protein
LRKLVIAAVAAFTIAAPAAVPATASANARSVARVVQRQYGRQVRNRARLSGIRILSVGVRCASDGGGQYSCRATYVAQTSQVTAKYAIYINVINGVWRTVGRPTLVWAHRN